MLNSFCREHGLAVIVDEVFLDYGLESAAKAPQVHKEHSRSAESAAPSKSGGGLAGQANLAANLAEARQLCGESGRADVYVERVVEDVGVATDEGGMGGDERAARSWRQRRWDGWK